MICNQYTSIPQESANMSFCDDRWRKGYSRADNKLLSEVASEITKLIRPMTSAKIQDAIFIASLQKVMLLPPNKLLRKCWID